MENKFFKFIKPYLSYIDKGNFFKRPFNWLYFVSALICLIIPIVIMYLAIDNNVFSSPAKVVIAFILIWIVISFACWVGFQIWWDRKEKVLESSVEGDDFIAIPTFSHYIQTSGEVYGTMLAIIGFGFSFFALIFLGSDAAMLSRQIGIPGLVQPGAIGMIISPLYGFIIIIVARVAAETLRALAAIANNTKKN